MSRVSGTLHRHANSDGGYGRMSLLDHRLRSRPTETPPGGGDGEPLRYDLAFIRTVVAHPRRTGAVVPSGRPLARLITREIDAASAPVIELGAGTGAVTREILDRGVPAAALTAVEADQRLAGLLRQRLPDVQVEARDVRVVLRELEADGARFGVVVSGLPLLNLPMAFRESLFRSSRAVLRPDGTLYQFTYGTRPPVGRAQALRLGFSVKRVGTVLLNLPPATVYRYRPLPEA